MPNIVKPSPGRIVLFQTDGRNYDYVLPAIVTITRANLVPEAVEAGVIPDLSSEGHVHLWVPGGKEPYYEYDVPFGQPKWEDKTTFRGARRSWRYPTHETRIIRTPDEPEPYFGTPAGAPLP